MRFALIVTSVRLFCRNLFLWFYHGRAFQGSAGNFSVLAYLFLEIFFCKGSLELCNAPVAVLRRSIEQMHLYA